MQSWVWFSAFALLELLRWGVSIKLCAVKALSPFRLLGVLVLSIITTNLAAAWEAWQVGTGPSFPDGTDDTFRWVDEGATMGKVSWDGNAYFVNNMTKLLADGGWQKPNPSTMAGRLWATLKDPAFSASGSTVSHKLTIVWDCTCVPTDTISVSQTPSSGGK